MFVSSSLLLVDHPRTMLRYKRYFLAILCIYAFVFYDLPTNIFSRHHSHLYGDEYIPSQEDISSSLDPRIVASFEKLASHKQGIVSQLPIEVRLLRTGAIEQEAKLVRNGFLTIKTQFSFIPKSGTETKNTPVPCTMTRSFRLCDFKEGGRYRYEINRIMNAIVLYDGTQAHYLVFSSKVDFEQATSLFQILVEQASRIPSEKKDEDETRKASYIFKKAGFQWIAVVPRVDLTETSWSILTLQRKGGLDNMIVWATKCNLGEDSAESTALLDELLKESKNLSPIFLFPLTKLDEWQFTTLPFIGAETQQIFSTPTQKQSASSDDPEELLKVASTSESVAFRVTLAPALQMPSIVICRNQDVKKVNKGIKLCRTQTQLPAPKVISLLPHYFQEDIPEGSTLRWLTGISPQSDDLLRSLFFDPPNSHKELFTHLLREYPFLKTILSAKSKIRKGMTIQNSILDGMNKISIPNELSTYVDIHAKMRRVSLATLLALETGALFGDTENFAQDGIQFAVTLEEKLGASGQEKLALEYFLLRNPIYPSSVREKEKSSKKKPASWLSQYMQERMTARSYHISFHEWIITRYIASRALSTAPQFKEKALEDTTNIIQLLASLPSAITDGSCVIATGLPSRQNILYVRPLFGAYFWEKLDTAAHRDGLSLARNRAKYEEHILKHPKSPWRNRFWEWITHKQSQNDLKLLPPTTYVTEKERHAYKACFENGVITAPKELISSEEEEIIFVVGLDGEMYLWKKSDAQSPEEYSFSHASFFSGAPVASSGKMTVRNGKIILITDHSGHYRPKRKEMLIALKTLRKYGVDISDIAVLHSASSSKTKLWGSGDAFLQENDDGENF